MTAAAVTVPDSYEVTTSTGHVTLVCQRAISVLGLRPWLRPSEHCAPPSNRRHRRQYKTAAAPALSQSPDVGRLLTVGSPVVSRASTARLRSSAASQLQDPGRQPRPDCRTPVVSRVPTARLRSSAASLLPVSGLPQSLNLTMSVLWALLLLFVLAAEREAKSAGCPERNVVPNFNLTKFMGRWRIFKEYNSASPFKQVCKEVKFTDNGDGSFRYRKTGIINSRRSYDGGKYHMGDTIKTAWNLVPHTLKNGSVSTGRFNIKYDHVPGNITRPRAKYNIVAAKYRRYAIMTGCSGFFGKLQEFVIILTRRRRASGKLRSAIKKEVKRLEMDKYQFTSIMQVDLSGGKCPTVEYDF